MNCRFAVALVLFGLAACGRSEENAAQARMDEVRQAEESAQSRRPLNDGSLTDIVRSALLSESSLDVRRIDVETRSGEVSIHGTVRTPAEREKVERIVMSVGGVRSVQNNLVADDAEPASSAVGPSSPSGITPPPSLSSPTPPPLGPSAPPPPATGAP